MTASVTATAANVPGSVGVVLKRKLAISPRGQGGAAQPDERADRNRPRRIAHHRGDDLTGARAERDAHADFLRAPRHGVRRHAEHADEGEDEAEAAEQAEQYGALARAQHLLREQIAS